MMMSLMQLSVRACTRTKSNIGNSDHKTKNCERCFYTISGAFYSSWGHFAFLKCRAKKVLCSFAYKMVWYKMVLDMMKNWVDVNFPAESLIFSDNSLFHLRESNSENPPRQFGHLERLKTLYLIAIVDTWQGRFSQTPMWISRNLINQERLSLTYLDFWITGRPFFPTVIVVTQAIWHHHPDPTTVATLNSAIHPTTWNRNWSGGAGSGRPWS